MVEKLATVGVDTDGDGKIDTFVSGVDADNDGIPDILQQGDGLGPEAKKLIKIFTGRRDAVEREDLIDYVHSKLKERESFMRLPFTLIFFVSFALFGVLHENIADNSMAQREIRNMLEGTTYEGVSKTSGHKVLDDVDGPTDFYNYLREAVVPLFIRPLSVPDRERHRVLRYNQIIGGIVLQQIRRTSVNCAEKYPNLGPFSSSNGADRNPMLERFNCYPWDTESDECFGPSFTGAAIIEGFCSDARITDVTGGRLLQDHPDVHSHRRLDFVPGGGGTGGYSKGMLPPPPNRSYFSVYLYEHEGFANAVTKLNQLEANSWIDINTAWVGVRLLILNPTLQTFVHVTVNFYMPPGGSVLPKVTAQSFIMEPYESKSIIAADTFYGLCVLWLTYKTFRGTWRAVRSDKWKEYVTDGWNFLDLLTVVASLAIGAFWATVVLALDGIKGSVVDAREAEPSPGQQNGAYPRLVAELHKDMVGLTDHLSQWRMFLCWYTLLIALKFLESFSAQPRLAVVTKSIILAGSDFFHFFVVVFTIFNAYVVSGMCIFGRRVWNWSNLSLAYNEAFLLLMGDMDYDELCAEYPLTAGLWFWTFILLVVLLMLNMLMAIVMDVYTEVKGHASDTDPIWIQLINIFRDNVGICFGRRLSNAEMMRNLQESTLEALDVKGLMKLMGPGMSREEAEKMLAKTRQMVNDRLQEGVHLNEALCMIGTVNTHVHAINRKLDQLFVDEEKDVKLMLSHKENRAFDTEDEVKGMLSDTEVRMQKVANHIESIDTLLRQSLDYTASRGDDLYGRVQIIEDCLISQLQKSAIATNVRRARLRNS